MRKILVAIVLSFFASTVSAQVATNTFWPPLPGSTMTGPILLPGSTKVADTRDDADQAAKAWAAMTDTQKNAVCALLALPNGCEAWPR